MTIALDAIKAHGESLFGNRGSLMSYLQEVAENCYPERADFTASRSLGTDFAANLLTSYPLMMRRDLGNAIGAMCRPSAKDWFAIRTNRPDREDTEARQWLEWVTKLQKNAMYDRIAQLVRATKEADNDFAAFGMAVIQSDMYRPLDGSTPHLLHRTWHLRDVAWAESHTGKIDTVYRKWDPPAIELVRLFPDTVSQRVKDIAQRTPYEKIKCWHVLMPAELYNSMDGAKKVNQKHVSLYIDLEADTELECVGQLTFNYTIPRWQTVSGSQYAHSPCTVAALPDMRLLQAITRVLLEAGEKAVTPPMIGVREAIRSDLELFAGGFTAVDAEYDERLGEVLRPITQDQKGLAFGHDLLKDIREQLSGAWMLNKLNLPPTQGGRDMTAYEVGQRVQEFIRNALPLFEPLESEYNGQLCEIDFELLMANSPQMRTSVPASIQGAEYRFVFESPLKDAIEKQKIGQFQEAAQILAAAQAMDPTATFILNGKKVVRDVMTAAVPAGWLNTEDAVDKLAADAQAAQKQQEMLQLMAQGAKISKDAGAGVSDIANATLAGGVAG